MLCLMSSTLMGMRIRDYSVQSKWSALSRPSHTTWASGTARIAIDLLAMIRALVAEIIELADDDAPDIERSRSVEQEVMDILADLSSR